MRLPYILLATVLLPIAAQAQFNLAPGSYQLASGAKGTASLKLVLAEAGRPTMMVGVKNGQERTFRSTEITSFSVEAHRFITVKDFRFRSGDDAGFKDPVILEAIEMGPVELFYYYYLVEMGPNFMAHARLPVLRKRGTSAFFAYCPGKTPGFDQRLAPGTFVAVLFAGDPGLQRRFATNAISRTELVGAVHAYNQGVRLTP